MKVIFGFFFTIYSTLLFAQKDELYLWKKNDFYKKLDTINTFSKNYPTKLIEGSGIIKNKRKKIIGSTGFETEITRNINSKLIRIFDSSNYFYKRSSKNPSKTINYSTYIYFDDSEKPDFAKIIREEIIREEIVNSQTNFYDLKEINLKKENLTSDERRLKNLINQKL